MQVFYLLCNFSKNVQTSEGSNSWQCYTAITEKPLGIGLGIGLSVGAINTYFLGIPLWLTLSSGAILGLIVCLIAAPGMKSELRARREAEARRKAMLRAKARTASAFTAFE